ncbi:class I SAM-dependent methyltransferase [Lutispora saccharofermentans]|uniref:Methyltransferase domain-containing protein n=1 Tax=Lutispora saccharofermentans TaxID=3024236 RepID=A0ABT1NI11_9FIRM|nr:class I SAM-dependent methyltransferase [Lutispora saccharofermentans]MCQ1529941.1 methyltransferase domain-containing protein [Lutispora saccharofermentans]
MLVDELKLYHRSDCFIWTDEHISKNMLSAHLDLEGDAASRNIRTIEKTIEWLTDKIPKGGKVLDLGCGPGLYSSLLAKKGYSVTGVDISKQSISYAKNKAMEEDLQIDYRYADYIKDDVGMGYDAVICIYCDFGALTPEEQTILLKKIHCGLSDYGIFIFDVFKIGLCSKMQEYRNWYYAGKETFWCDKPHFVLEEVKHFIDYKTWGSRTIIIEEGKAPKEFIIWDNYYTEDDIEKLLKNNGFKILSINSKLVAENEFTSNDVMFIEAKKSIHA